jgi:hypothetical protein
MIKFGCDVQYKIGDITANVKAGNITSVTVGAWNRALKSTWEAIGRHLHEKFVQKHFTKTGAAEYRSGNVAGDGPVFEPRSGEGESGKEFWKSYTGRKQKSRGHQLPLVYTGETRDGAKRATINATNNGVTVTLPGCVGINRYKPKVKKYGKNAGAAPIDIRRDLLAISRQESDQIRAMHTALMVRQFGGRWLGTYANGGSFHG